MKPVAVLRHGPAIGMGYLGDALEAAAAPVLEVPLYSGAALPPLDGVAAVVVLGGVMGAYDEPTYPFLAAEKQYIRDAAQRDMPVLGVCLGGQLAADALGGRAYLAPRPEVGVLRVALTEAGATDPVACHLDGPVLVWHQDTWDPPPGAVELARSDAYPMAFRLGSVVGIQPHPEASPEMARSWVDASPGWLEGRGFDADVLLRELEGARADSQAVAEAFFGAWVGEVVG